jgi:hypothetical protein
MESDIHRSRLNHYGDKDGWKRFDGHYAKAAFAELADQESLQKFTYIYTMPADAAPSRLSQMNKRDELSVLINSHQWTPGEIFDVNYDLGNLLEGDRVGFLVKGWVTWAQNKNAATGHFGSLLRNSHGGVRPESGVNKAPAKMYGQSVPPHQLKDVFTSYEDFEDIDLVADGWGNNEGLIDNWEILGVLNIQSWTDHDSELTEERRKQEQVALEAAKTRWPNAVLIPTMID